MKRRVPFLRSRLGINQQLLAGYLGISRSALNMHERNERSASTAAIIKEGKLYRALDSPTLPTAYLQGFADKENEQVKKDMQAIVNDCNKRLVQAEKVQGTI